MKKIAVILMLTLVFLATPFAKGTAETDKAPLVGISKFLSHPALDAVEEGVQDYLKSIGKEVRYDFQNANGEVSASAQIAQKFKSDRVAVSLGIATPVAQALANVFSDEPVVFSAVTDPVDAGLVPSYSVPHGGNVAGVSDMSPVESQIELLAKLTGAKTIGNVYASGEANGVILMEQAKAATEKLGLQFVTAAVANTAEVKQALQAIINRVDAVYIATDNTVVSAIPSIDDVANKAGVPYMASDPSLVEGLDFLVAWGFDYYKIGLATGKIIEQVLDGKPAGDIGTVFLEDPNDFELWFNLDVADRLNIKIDEDLVNNAAVIYKNGQKIVQ